VVFAHSKRADEWQKLNARFGSVQEGAPYFVHNNRMVQLSPHMKLGWISGVQYWCSTTATGQLTAVSFKEMPEPFRERVWSAVLVYLEDCIVPAAMEWRTVKCSAAKTLSDTLTEAATPAWPAKGPAHEATLIVAQPMLRFYGDVTLGDKRAGKTSGLPYQPAQCEVHPTGPAEWKLIQKLIDDPESQKLFDEVAIRYQSKLKELESKAIRA
jgi:hypothetical protein